MFKAKKGNQYQTDAVAFSAAAALSRERGVALYPYFCDICGLFHIGKRTSKFKSFNPETR